MTNREGSHNIVEMRELIMNSKAWQTQERLHKLRAPFYVLTRNHEELQQFLSMYETRERAPYESMAIYRENKQFIHLEIGRLLLNLLASAKAYVEYIRGLIRSNYQGESFYQSYKEQINIRFGDSDLVAFVEGLRNYTLHYALPASGALMQMFSSIEDDCTTQDRFTFYLDRDVLLSEWRWKGKPYLESSGEKLIISEFEQEYYSLVAEFHSWLEHKLYDLHKGELEWLYKKASEHDELAASMLRAIQKRGP